MGNTTMLTDILLSELADVSLPVAVHQFIYDQFATLEHFEPFELDVEAKKTRFICKQIDSIAELSDYFVLLACDCRSSVGLQQLDQYKNAVSEHAVVLLVAIQPDGSDATITPQQVKAFAEKKKWNFIEFSSTVENGFNTLLTVFGELAYKKLFLQKALREKAQQAGEGSEEKVQANTDLGRRFLNKSESGYSKSDISKTYIEKDGNHLRANFWRYNPGFDAEDLVLELEKGAANGVASGLTLQALGLKKPSFSSDS